MRAVLFIQCAAAEILHCTFVPFRMTEMDEPHFIKRAAAEILHCTFVPFRMTEMDEPHFI